MSWPKDWPPQAPSLAPWTPEPWPSVEVLAGPAEALGGRWWQALGAKGAWRLPAGDYPLPAKAWVKGELRLEGAGPGATRLLVRGPAWGLKVAPGARLALSGLSLVVEGQEACDALVLDSGEARLQHVILQGAKAGRDWTQEPRGPGGRGLVAWGEAALWAQEVEFVRHQAEGLVLLDHAQAFLKGCLAMQNLGGGLWAQDHSRLTLWGGETVVNFRDGVALHGHARAALEGLKAGRNGGEGFAAYGGAQLWAWRCQSAENQGHGFLARHHAELSVEGGSARANAHHGLAAQEEATAWVRGHLSEGNGLSGHAWLGHSKGHLAHVRALGNRGLGLQLGLEAQLSWEHADAEGNGLGDWARLPS